jgi:oligopeptide transport system permease protein
VFALLEWSPGGVIAPYLQKPDIGPADIVGLSHLGTQPHYVHYLAWLTSVLRGDLGWSPTASEPAAHAIAERLPMTVGLFAGELAAVILAGAVIGFVQARAPWPALREAVRFCALVARAVPALFLAPVLQLAVIFSGAAAYSIDPLVLVLAMVVPFGAWSSLIFSDAFRTVAGGARTPPRIVLGAAAETAASIGPAVLAATLALEELVAWRGIGQLFMRALFTFDAGATAGALLCYSFAVVLLRLCGGLVPRSSPRAPDPQPTTANRRIRLSSTTVAALGVLAGAAAVAIAANLIAPAGPYVIDRVAFVGYPLAPGVAGHVLGTDENGRDLLARTVFGLRTSLGIAAVATLIAVLLGAAAARAVPRFARRDGPGLTGIRSFAALPFLLTVLTVLVAQTRSPEVVTPVVIAVLIGLAAWPAAVPVLHGFDSVTIGGIIGLAGCALLLEVSLSIRGFGVQPPVPSLGNLFEHVQMNLPVAPWAVIVPSVAMIAVLFALYALADALGGAREPRTAE